MPSAMSATDVLLQQSDITYLGAFRVPNTNGEFNYGGRPIAFNPANNTLFIGNGNVELVGREGIAEINIPALVNTSNLASMNTASYRQTFTNAFSGNLNSIEPNQGAMFGGILLSGSKLIISGYGFYDATSGATKSHSSINANWTASGLGYSGLVTVAVPPAPQVGYTGGYMCPIPTSWQAALGGTALTGMSNICIMSRTSFGPAAFSFDPTKVGSVNPVPGTALLYYDDNYGQNGATCATHWTLGDYSSMEGCNAGAVSPILSGSDLVTGVVFPEGSKSILYFGRHGDTYCYGTGVDCNDPDVSDKGTHGYPYHYRIWAYNAEDLAAVKSGTKKPWEVKPYSYWNLDDKLPFLAWKKQVNGATYDPATKRIYMSQDHGDGSAPLIQVFSVNVTASPPAKRPSTPSLQIR